MLRVRAVQLAAVIRLTTPTVKDDAGPDPEPHPVHVRHLCSLHVGAGGGARKPPGQPKCGVCNSDLSAQVDGKATAVIVDLGQARPGDSPVCVYEYFIIILFIS